MTVNRFYDIECTNEELSQFTVRKKKDNTVYHITKRSDGSWVHECKARLVYGDRFLCRHLKMIIAEYYINPSHKSLFNISPKRSNGENTDN